MNVKRVLVTLLLMQFSALSARWVVREIDFGGSDLSSKDSVAYYGKNSSKELAPLTNALQSGAEAKKIAVPSSHGAVGKNSQGFNKFTLHDEFGAEHAVVFDGQNAFRLQQGRVKAAALDPDLGRYTSDLKGHVARAELQKDGDVLVADSQSHQNEGDEFSMVIQGQNGNYSLKLCSS